MYSFAQGWNLSARNPFDVLFGRANKTIVHDNYLGMNAVFGAENTVQTSSNNSFVGNILGGGQNTFMNVKDISSYWNILSGEYNTFKSTHSMGIGNGCDVSLMGSVFVGNAITSEEDGILESSLVVAVDSSPYCLKYSSFIGQAEFDFDTNNLKNIEYCSLMGKDYTVDVNTNALVGTSINLSDSDSNIKHSYSKYFGLGIKSTGNHQIIYGHYNALTDARFVIGNGSDDTLRSNLIELQDSGVIYIDKMVGDTANRPTPSKASSLPYFDTDLGKPIWYDGSNWVDATGATA